MWHRFVLVLTCISLAGSAFAQAPALDTFTSPDGTFHFAYPQNYELLVGDRILHATQSRHAGVSICDFGRSLACVMYPIDGPEKTWFEWAGFAVNAVPGTSSESECLQFAETEASSEQTHPARVTINSQSFLYVSNRIRKPGQLQVTDSYRAFSQGRCYELKIAVAVTEGLSAHSSNGSPDLADASAERARESLRLILSSFILE